MPQPLHSALPDTNEHSYLVKDLLSDSAVKYFPTALFSSKAAYRYLSIWFQKYPSQADMFWVKNKHLLKATAFNRELLNYYYAFATGLPLKFPIPPPLPQAELVETNQSNSALAQSLANVINSFELNTMPEYLQVQTNAPTPFNIQSHEEELVHENQLPSGVYVLSEHKQKIIDNMNDTILINHVWTNVQSLLNLRFTPCVYKKKLVAGCHSYICRQVVNLYIGHNVLRTMIGDNYIVNPEAKSYWKTWAEGLNDTSMCPPSDVDEYTTCLDCGEYYFKSVAFKLKKITGYNCWNCYQSNVRLCENCSVVSTKKMHFVHINGNQEVQVCHDCLGKFEKCIQCNSLWNIIPLVNGRCINCLPNLIHDYMYKPDAILYNTNSDKIATPYFGIELEVEMKPEQKKLMHVIAARFQKDIDKLAYLKKDSSIANGFEIVSHPMTLNFWNTNADAFWNALKKLTKHCESWSVDNCGIHVHVGRTTFESNAHIAKFMAFINNNRLFSAFIAERYNAKQAPFMDLTNSTTALNIASCTTPIDRHTAVNVQKTLPTVEVRIFKGNMRKRKIMKNIEFVHAVQSYTKKATFEDMAVKDFIAFVAGEQITYPNLYSYIKKYKKDI